MLFIIQDFVSPPFVFLHLFVPLCPIPFVPFVPPFVFPLPFAPLFPIPFVPVPFIPLFAYFSLRLVYYFPFIFHLKELHYFL